MHKKFIVIAFVLGLVTGWCQTQAPMLYTQGTDFWAAFTMNSHNYNVWTPAPLSVPSANLRFCITSDKSTEGHIYGMPNEQHPFGRDYRFFTRPDSITYVEVAYEDFMIVTPNMAQPKGLHVVAEDTIAVWILNYQTINSAMSDGAVVGSSAVSELLPTPALRDDYVIQVPEHYHFAEEEPSYFLILATEDNTDVEIVLRGPCHPDHNAGDTVRVHLNQGDVYMMYDKREVPRLPNGRPDFRDLSGTHIKAADCKRIAVFQGNKCANYDVVVHMNFPDDVDNRPSTDHLMEQCIPTEYLGNHYFAIPSTNHHTETYHDTNIVKITALEDDTWVLRNGFPRCLLNAYQTFIDTIIRPNVAYEYQSDNPIALSQYVLGGGQNGGVNDTAWGDPSTLVLPPIEWMTSRVHLPTVWNDNYPQRRWNYLTIICPTSDVNGLRLYWHNYRTHDYDTVDLSSPDNAYHNQFQTFPSNPDYSFTRFIVQGNTISTHDFVMTIENINGGKFYANLMAEALGVTHFYNMSPTHPSNVFMYIDDINVDRISDDSLYCIFDTLQLHMLAQMGAQQIYWNFGEDNTLNPVDSGAVTQHRYRTPGTYTITCWAIYPDEGCFTPKPDTLSKVVTMTQYIDSNVVVDGCEGPYHFYHKTYMQSTIDTVHVNWFSQCDSIFHLDLTLYKRWTHLRDTIHQDDLPWFFNGHTYQQPVTNDTIRIDDGQLCDSVIIYTLRVLWNPPPSTVDSTALWVPNVFTPSEPTNNIFFVRGHEIEQVQVFIFDRMGRKLYEWEGLDGGWDGTHNGTPCPQAGYVYLIRYKTIHSDGYKYRKGVVTLVR